MLLCCAVLYCCVAVLCCTVLLCCCAVLCCTVLLCYCSGHRLRVTTLSYTTGLIPSVVTLQLQHRVVTVGCCTAVLHCCAALLCCTVVLYCCAVLLRSVRRPLRVTTPSCHPVVRPHSQHRKVALRGTEVVWDLWLKPATDLPTESNQRRKTGPQAVFRTVMVPDTVCLFQTA